MRIAKKNTCGDEISVFTNSLFHLLQLDFIYRTTRVGVVFTCHVPDNCREKLGSENIDGQKSGQDTELADHGQSCDHCLIF